MFVNVDQTPNMPASVLGSEEEEIDDFPALVDLVDLEGARVHQTTQSNGRSDSGAHAIIASQRSVLESDVRFTSVFKTRVRGGQIGSFHHVGLRDRTGVKLSRQRLFPAKPSQMHVFMCQLPYLKGYTKS